jgi:hypothetical protein
MAVLGLTKKRSADRKAIALLILELAKISNDLWRVPIEERKALVASIRIACRVPENLDNLDNKTISLIAKEDGMETARAYKEAIQWINDAEAFTQKFGTTRLSNYHKDNATSKLKETLQESEESTNELTREHGSAKMNQDVIEARLGSLMPTLVKAFMFTSAAMFESQIQRQALKHDVDCYWGKAFPKQYASFLKLMKQSDDNRGAERMLSILSSAILESSSEISKIIDE